MADPSGLRELLTLVPEMRAQGISRVRVGELELVLGPLPPPVAHDAPAPVVDEADSDEAALLYGTGLSVEQWRELNGARQ